MHIEQEFEDPIIKVAADDLKRKLDAYWSHMDQDLVILAAVLDPRVKLSLFSGDKLERAILLLEKQFEIQNTNLNASKSTSTTSSGIEVSNSLSPSASSSSSHDGDTEPTYFSDVYLQASSDEVQNYLKLEREKRVCDIMAYWKTNSATFPKLYELALTIMSVQSTSVASERTFSIAGLLDTARRNRLSPESFRSNVLLGSWLKFLNFH